LGNALRIKPQPIRNNLKSLVDISRGLIEIIFAKSSLVSRRGLEALSLDRQFAWLALEDVERGMAQERG
jgi:hypothetical protein